MQLLPLVAAMKSPRPFLAFVVMVLGLCHPGVCRAKFTLFSHVWGDVIVATDMTEEGKALTQPTIGKPVYYRGKSLGCKFGSIAGDRLPDVNKLNQYVAEILAKQGYVGSTPGVHEPTLFLVLQWGYLQPGNDDLVWFLGYDARNDIAAPSFPGVLGPEIFRRDFRSREIETILTNVGEPNYGIIITAFEYKSASTAKPIVYWQTRIALPALGKSMAEALPTMVAAAGPAIGRQSNSPRLMDADTVIDGHVELGELKLMDYEQKRAETGKVTVPNK
jgi:hypothetical protein